MVHELLTAIPLSIMAAGIFPRREVRPLAHLLLASLVEAAMLIANAPDPKAAREEIEGPLLTLLEGLRAQPGSRTILPSLPPAANRS